MDRKYVLILGDKLDSSIDSVIDWISILGFKFIRIDIRDIEKYNFTARINNNNFFIENEKQTIYSEEIVSVWFRGYKQLSISEKLNEYNSLYDKIDKNLRLEFLGLYAVIRNALKNIFWLNKLEDLRITKIDQLLIAKQVGLNIPHTIITNVHKEKILNKVTKPIQSTFYFEGYHSYTKRANNEETNLFPTLFQNEIKKQYEIRAIFLCGNFYSVAIFSQPDSNAEVDSRKIDFNSPNRIVPYLLPKKIQVKLIELLEILKINFGSIDLIKSKDGMYYFLEINPIGQFLHYSNIKTVAIFTNYEFLVFSGFFRKISVKNSMKIRY